MKNISTGILFALLLTIFGCQMDGSPNPTEPIVEPRFSTLLERDTIISGGYLGMSINEKAETIYSNIQSLRVSNGVSYVNVVSNIFSDITQLRNRIPLYQYILLDQSEGTDSGIQITIELEKVKSIYLNSGKKLSQWPEKSDAKSSVRIGDQAGELYQKMLNIYNKGIYARKFERISLLTKDVSLSFDPLMAQSPQWYFAYTTGIDLWELVQMHLKNGKLDYIVVERYKK